mgnify:CR=1 FL=1
MQPLPNTYPQSQMIGGSTPQMPFPSGSQKPFSSDSSSFPPASFAMEERLGKHASHFESCLTRLSHAADDAKAMSGLKDDFSAHNPFLAGGGGASGQRQSVGATRMSYSAAANANPFKPSYDQ